MKRFSPILVVAAVICLCAVDDSWAQRRGGGSGRGGARPSTGRAGTPSRPAVKPSPSLPSAKPNLPSSKPAVSKPTAGLPNAGNRPSQSDLMNFLDNPKPATGGANRPAQLPSERPSAGAAADFLNPRNASPARDLPSPPTTADRPVAGRLPAAGEAKPAQNLPGQIDNREQWRSSRDQRHGQVSEQMQRYPNHRDWYNADFWRLHPHPHWALHAGVDWWKWATWATVTRWVVYSWPQPAYYNYGENVYYQDGSVYYGSEPVATAEEYSEQAAAIATSIPEEVKAEEAEWLSLGVFAITQDGQASGTEPTAFLQLAVSKEGILAGTLQNTKTDTVLPVEGMVDKASQRAAWTVVDQRRPIMETGIHNLTQDTAPALVHFEDGRTEQFLLVRIESETVPAGN